MKILIINGNPKEGSLCEYIENVYVKSLNGIEFRVIRLKELTFDYNYRDNGSDENDVIMARREILLADHIVFIFPLWWGSFPAVMKAFIDRVFVSGFAYKYVSGKSIPQKLLIGKTASIVITMDSPVWYYKYIKGARAEKQLKTDILDFCGIQTIRTIRIGSVRDKKNDELNSEIHDIVIRKMIRA